MNINLELHLNDGNIKDNTVYWDGTHEDLKQTVLDMVSPHFDDGYKECNPSYYNVSERHKRSLVTNKCLLLNGILRCTI